VAVRITYATMTADNEELHAAYETGVETARSWLGQDHLFYVNGKARSGEGWHEERSPIDSNLVIGRFAQGTPEDVDDAVAAAREFAQEWADTPWPDRAAILKRAADITDERTPELAGLLSLEVGKNRLEALGDAAEVADFFRYYIKQMKEHDGYVKALGRLSPNEDNASVLRPYGVWAVISPFNFPFALAAGPTIAALLTGNVVVLKPSNAGGFAALKFYEIMRDAGLPAAAFHVITGAGAVVGKALIRHPDVAGITFTGSYEVGMEIYHNFATRVPKPVICEMGGKNPSIVSDKADLDVATDGIWRAAFGFQGQKCSANSRVYVERSVFDEFVDKLSQKADKLVVGDPLDRNTYMGPVIDQAAVTRFKEAVQEVKRSGGRIISGGEVLDQGDLATGNFVQPTVAVAPEDSWVWQKELFLPFVVVGPVDSIEEGIDKANNTEFGLTAGFFSNDNDEIDEFFRRIEAGVTYVNRRAGSTTGAWPDIQSFGGWKGSGTSGTGGGGPYYLRQYLREQSRTVVS